MDINTIKLFEFILLVLIIMLVVVVIVVFVITGLSPFPDNDYDNDVLLVLVDDGLLLTFLHQNICFKSRKF